MIKLFNKIVIIISVLIMTFGLNIMQSCNQSSDVNLEESIVDSEPLVGRIISAEGEISTEPLRMVYLEPFLVYYSLREDKRIKVFDCNLGKVTARFASHGKGPNELMSVGNLNLHSEKGVICIYDFVKQEIFTVSLNHSDLSDLRISKQIKLNLGAQQAFLLDTFNTHLDNGVFSDGRFKLFNENSLVSNFKTFPEIGTSNRSDTGFLNLGYQNFSAVNPNLDRFANIVFGSEIVEGFEIIDKKVNRMWSNEWSMKPFSLEKVGGGKYAKHSDESTGFKNLAVNNKNIYCVYSDIPFKENRKLAASGYYLVVFNWKGNIEQVYKTQYPIRTITVSQDGKKLWGTSIIDTDIKIIEFSL